MIFEQHNNLRGKHAFLSPSQPQWLKYSKEQLRQKRISSYSQPMGTSLHALAETLIANGLKLKKGDNLILAAFGAGFTWGAIYLKWGYNGKQA